MSIRLVGLGGLRCYVDGVQTDSAQKLRLALLSYLAIERHAPRESLATLFWPEKDEERARHALAQTIYELRRSVGESWLNPQPDPLEVTDELTSDVLEFEEHVRKGDLEKAFALYDGEFLQGFHIKGSNEFESWADAKRRELKRLHHRACRDHLKNLVDSQRFEDAIAHVHHWISVDPLDDEANHALLDLLVGTGRRSEAVAHYREYSEELKKQLDVHPLEQTQKLMASLHTQQAALPLTASGATPVLLATGASSVGFVGELTRRRVFKMAAWYAGSLLLAIQVVQIMIDAFYIVPPELLNVTLYLGALGFPVALLLAWQFDITPDGIKRTQRFSDTAAVLYPKWRLVAAAVLLILLTGAAALSTTGAGDAVRRWGRTPSVKCTGASCDVITKIESNRYAVLPLTHQNSASPHLMDGELCARLIADGLSHWDDINLADPLALNDELRKLSPELRAQIPRDSGIAIARRVGAGRVVMGELWQYGDSTRVQAVLYDAVAGKQLKVIRTRLAVANMAPEREFARLAQQLLLDDSKVGVALPSAVATTSWAALVSYDSAFKAIAKWDLPLAQGHLTNALERDANYRHADLWLAHVLLWQSDSSELFRFHAGRARAAKERFGAADALLADGIGLLAERRYQESCAAYRALLARDSASFHAWFGLSECLASDKRVVADTKSPTGYSFASSYREAIQAHERALRLVPSFNESFVNLGGSRLASLLFLNTGRVRLGIGDNNVRFGSRPQMINDTIAFIPYLYTESADRSAPATMAAVITEHREVQRRAVTAWAVEFPNSTKALQALSLALEQNGEIDHATGDGNTALEIIRRARKLSEDKEERLRLALVEVRLLIKAGNFKEARRLAVRTIKDNHHPSPEGALALAGIAGLVGRPHTMARLFSEGAEDFDKDLPSSGVEMELPIEFARDVGRLLAYAHIGEPKDSITRISQRAHAFLTARVPVQDRTAMHETGLDRAARTLFHAIGPDDSHRLASPSHPTVRLQRMLMLNDTANLRLELQKLAARRSSLRPGDVAADAVHSTALLHLALKDTVAAVNGLENYLNDLRNVSVTQFSQPYQPATLVRVMELRARLAAKSDDRATARRWSRAVIDLWQDGDKELKPLLHDMRKLARF